MLTKDSIDERIRLLKSDCRLNGRPMGNLSIECDELELKHFEGETGFRARMGEKLMGVTLKPRQ